MSVKNNDLIRRSDVMNMLSVFNDRVNGNNHFINGIETAKELLESAPVVDAVEVVRCRDCARYRTKYCPVDTWTADVTIYKAEPDDFCSYGERRADGEQSVENSEADANHRRDGDGK